MKRMLQSKQRDQFDTVWKEVENEEININSLQKKAKANVNIDCFSLMKGQ